jgi:hypothetical protein
MTMIMTTIITATAMMTIRSATAKHVTTAGKRRQKGPRKVHFWIK